MTRRSLAVAAAVAMLSSHYEPEHLPAAGPGMPTIPRRRLPPLTPSSADLNRLQAAEAKRARRAARRLGGKP